ncbi:unnamed protein product [Rhizophagus irregularis]|nr:unnamed protein product [Rhizophagus irregularis]
MVALFYNLRVNELFARSFEKDANINKYEFTIVTEEGTKIDITKDVRKNIKINSSGGTPPFRKDYECDIFSVDKFVGGKFIVKHEEKEFASALIKQEKLYTVSTL